MNLSIGYIEGIDVTIERIGWWIDQNFDWEGVAHWMPLPHAPMKLKRYTVKASDNYCL